MAVDLLPGKPQFILCVCVGGTTQACENGGDHPTCLPRAKRTVFKVRAVGESVGGVMVVVVGQLCGGWRNADGAPRE